MIVGCSATFPTIARQFTTRLAIPANMSVPDQRFIAVAHDVRSLHNVGAILRTADGAGCTEVWLSGYTGAPPDPRIAKVALGADESLPNEHVGSLDSLLERLVGFWVVLLEQLPSSQPPTEVRLPMGDPGQPVALIVCSEVTGSPARLVARADAVIEIPMRGTKESLNVSVAFGIAAYALAERLLPTTLEHVRSRSHERNIRPGVLTGDPWMPDQDADAPSPVGS